MGCDARLHVRTWGTAAPCSHARLSSPQARDHARQLLEKHVKKPFFESARYADGKERMTPDEVSAGLTWLSERFVLIRYEDEELPSIDWVLDTARAAVMRCVR